MRRVLFFGLIGLVVYAVAQKGASITLSVAIPQIAGAILALVLTFRTNQAYNRFWEGRTLWGAIVNASRNATRLFHAHVKVDDDEKRTFAAWTALTAHAVRLGLRRQRWDHVAVNLVSQEDLRRVTRASNRSVACAMELSVQVARAVERGAVSSIIAAQIESEIAALVDALGGCERIHKTPMPVGYVLLVRRCLAGFLLTLPFGIVERAGVYTPLVTMAVAYFALMMEGIGNELDDPFGHDPNDLPLSRICANLERNLLDTAITRVDPPALH